MSHTDGEPDLIRNNPLISFPKQPCGLMSTSEQLHALLADPTTLHLNRSVCTSTQVGQNDVTTSRKPPT